MWRRLGIILASVASPALGDSVIALRTLPARTVVTEADVTVVDADVEGAYTSVEGLLGQEVRATVYAGRPLRMQDVGPPALVDRNQTVDLVFQSGGLMITTEGRALERGAEGDNIRAMNLKSKTTVHGRIAADGRIFVGDMN